MTLEHLDTIISFVAILTGVSLLVTTLTQMASALLGLRGSNLRWGITTLLEHADPSLAEHAAAISEKVLHHPMISDSSMSGMKSGLFTRWKLATAIRKEELIEILRVLASQAAPAGASPTQEPWVAALRNSLDQLDRGDADKLLQLAPAIRQALPDDAAKADAIISQLTTSAEQLSGNINQWFDAVMDRVSQRFMLHTRLWTVCFSVLIAFALHLDAFKLLTQLSSDSELRARLVTSADALTKKADEITATAANGSPAVYVSAMNQLIAGHANELKALPPPSGFTTLAGGKAWLERELKSVGIGDTEPWLRRYEDLVPQATLLAAADDFHSILNDKLKLQLVPDPYPQPFYSYWTPGWSHFWGIVASAALLSLGAPFWFNLLKTLSSLRPILAKKQEKEAAADSDAG